MVGNLVRGAGEPGKDYITLFAGLVAPLSRGSVTINSSDTAIQPVIDPAWFTNPSDVEIAVQVHIPVSRSYLLLISAGIQAPSPDRLYSSI